MSCSYDLSNNLYHLQQDCFQAKWEEEVITSNLLPFGQGLWGLDSSQCLAKHIFTQLTCRDADNVWICAVCGPLPRLPDFILANLAPWMLTTNSASFLLENAATQSA